MDNDTSYQFPLALHWDLGPEKLKELKNKLLVYFQSKSKSNGGECVIKDPDSTKGYVLIHFSQETVRDAVVKKETHEMHLSGGKRLKLDVSLPKEPIPTSNQKPPADSTEPRNHQVPEVTPHTSFFVGPPSLNVTAEAASTEEPPSMNVGPETSPSVALIESIADSCTPEILILLVENISNKCAGTDFTLEMIPEIKSAAVTFSCNIDIPNFIIAFLDTRRVKQMKLRAKPLEETKCIRVENLPPNTSDDYLMMYFECPRYGGGAVEEVELLSEEDAAIITFSDKQVIRKVLEKQHVFGKKSISVYPYYESLGVALYGEKGPCVTLPKPLEFPVSPYVLEFILGNPQIKDNMHKKMTDKNCELTWPEPNCSNPNIKLSIPRSISSNLRTVAKIVHTWRDHVSTEFSNVISKFKAAEYNVSPSVWEAIIGEVSSPTYEGVLVKPDVAKQKVFLAGLSKDITKIEQTFRDLVENTTRRIDRQNSSMEMSEPLAPALYEIMCKNGHLKNIQSQAPELRMEYDVPNRNLKLYGVKEEALFARCELLKIIQQLKFKSIPLDSHIIHFLGLTDNDELSCLLLTRHNINAKFQTEDKSVTLTGLSMNDLSEAEEQMRRELVCKQLTVEDKMIIKGHEWKSLKTHLCKLFNSERCTVLIEEFPRGAENQVVIAGLAPSVGTASEQIHDFLERNTPILKDIPVKSVAVIQFIKEEKKDTCKEIKKKNVSVTLKRKSITLSGCRLYVEEASNLMEGVLSSLHNDVLTVNKPGAKKFFIDKEEMLVSTAKHKYKCLIYLQKEGEEDSMEIDINVDEEPQYQIRLPYGITIAVYKDDLTRHRVDVVVNAANEDLKHIGGLALALLRAAGPKLQTDCDHIVKTSGRLFAGDAKITDGGSLPCKQVIHAVGPRWDPSSQVKCERHLRKAITNSLELATENGHSSIGIPAVSAGIFGFPLERCIKNITESISQFLEDYQGTSSIKRIHIVDTDDKIISTFIKALKVEFGDTNEQESPKRKVEEERRRPNAKPEGTREPALQMINVNGITIKLIKGNLQDATTDIIVNSVGKDLDLDNGGASKALLRKAGKKLQYVLNEECKGKQVQEGSVFATNGCDLSCQMVLHVITPYWNHGSSSGAKTLREIIHTCLSSTEKKQMTSITFPAIGTGALSFPKNLVAAIMFEEVEKFTGSKNIQHLQEVNFVLHPSDMDTITAFFGELKKRIGTNAPQVNPGPKPIASKSSGAEVFGSVTTPNLGIHEMKIGSVTYQVKTGDITKETTDVIVNSSNGNFTLRTGVSKAILEAAGQSVADECAKLGSMPHRGFIITDKGNLLCKKILHVCGRNSQSEIKSCVLDALQECERLQVTSVAFPAIGSGGGSVRPMDVADAMQEAVIEFITSKSSQCLQMVKVVIFQEKMLQDFYRCMKNKEGTIVSKQTSLLGKISSFFGSLFSFGETEEPSVIMLKENIEPANFYLCGEARDQVKAAKLWLEKLIQQEQSENIITNDWILEFDEREQQKLCELQKRSQVSISFEYQRSTIIVSGLTRDVFYVSKEIEDMIKTICAKKTREREADLCSNLVEWRYHNGFSYVPFDKMSNLDLETAKSEGRQSLTIKVKGVHYTVNMELKSASDPSGKTVKIERAPKSGESMELPPGWENMTSEQVKVVPLNPGAPEYNDVQSQFQKSCPMKIIKIERIQNKHLWLNYQIKKQSIDAKNQSTSNEMQLFHGSDPNTIKNVNQNGFNRSYAGRNAAYYGNGTYFAVNANYSAQDTYSRPDPNGHKHMYLARVLTGISCVGQQGMVAPPAKNPSNPTDLYDSVTDRTSSPVMFVIFNDIQAYPEYLITFSR
ncbi:protein mono-ADP-ribosyltransferase PARP14 isoform X2 [Xenopus laevis]|uniref:Poly [ADP-ribose] polymerase n=1 Tax=Xenopus laevis TaxID=8355 RepID=A0A8J0TVN1_XENLA|nr:protein mono-ADP-ribosyltransferase PARP14 isoform X2 [Xenopus laevis]